MKRIHPQPQVHDWILKFAHTLAQGKHNFASCELREELEVLSSMQSDQITTETDRKIRQK